MKDAIISLICLLFFASAGLEAVFAFFTNDDKEAKHQKRAMMSLLFIIAVLLYDAWLTGAL